MPILMPIKILAILLMTCPAFAQPEGTPPPPIAEQAQTEKNSPQDAETLRKRLAQTLEFAKRIVEKNEAAIEQLDQGQDPRVVMKELRSPQLRRAMSDQRRMRPQGATADTHQHPPQPNISKRDLKRVRNFINEHLPEIDSQLQMIEKMSPNSTEKLLTRLAPKVIDILRLNETNPTMAGLKIDELKAGLNYVDAASSYRALVNSETATQSQRDQALQAVRQAASDRFDAQLQIKQFEIQELTQRIEQLHQALKNLSDQRDQQVQAQVNAAQRNFGSPANRAARIKQRQNTQNSTQSGSQSDSTNDQ